MSQVWEVGQVVLVCGYLGNPHGTGTIESFSDDGKHVLIKGGGYGVEGWQEVSQLRAVPQPGHKGRLTAPKSGKPTALELDHP